MRRFLRKLCKGIRVRWERDFFRNEGLSVLILTAAFIWWAIRCGGFELIEAVLGRNRPQVYGTLATIFGSLLGFIIVAVSVVKTTVQSERFQALRAGRAYEQLWKVYFSSIRALATATVVSLVALIFDRPGNPERWLVVAVFGLGLYAAVRLARAVWALERVVKLSED